MLDPRSVDDLFFESKSEPITEDDAFLARIVDSADLPALLAAVAAATGDASVLTADIRPPLTPVDTVGHPHGGMTPEQQVRARQVALSGLRELRDRGISSSSILSKDEVDAILTFLTNDRPKWFPVLKHELDLTGNKGAAPDWSFQEISRGRPFETLIVGAGLAGIAAAHRFSQAGVNVTIIEATSALGGTWMKNRYPGVRLDTPTFGYSFSFAQRGDWPHQFAEGHEILDYAKTVAERAGLVERIEFSTKLKSARWNESEGVWEVITEGTEGKQLRRFNAVVSALGQLDSPNIPDFAGRKDFAGVTMHSQEWRQDADLSGKRVAVIGTGASAYQIVPAIVDQVDKLVLFQRSAPWMLPAPTYHDPMPETFSWLRRKVPHYAQWYRLWVTLLGIPGRFHTVRAEPDWPGAPLSVSARNQDVRDTLIAELERQFEGRPDLLAHVVPNYPPGAKRMLRDNGVWSRALKSEHTTLVTSGINRFTDSGIIDNSGLEHPVDVVIYATGFEASDYLDEVEVVGRGGLEIHDFWNGDARAYNGVTVPGFPNFFMIYGPNVGGVVAGSLHFMLERASEYALKAVRTVIERGIKAIDVRQTALDRFVAWVDVENRQMAWGQDYVDSWYKNGAGRVSQVWPFTNAEYWEITEAVNMDDYEEIP